MRPLLLLLLAAACGGEAPEPLAQARFAAEPPEPWHLSHSAETTRAEGCTLRSTCDPVALHCRDTDTYGAECPAEPGADVWVRDEVSFEDAAACVVLECEGYPEDGAGTAP